ncbi:MAG TPA: deoxyribonuclease V [Gallionellaceae bacterium]|nr:deoxyribonuclease V [Gallionellaceae bacterium]
MRPVIDHPWQLTPAEAVALQNALRQRVERADRLPLIRYMAGVDAGYEEGGRVARAAVAVLAFPSLELVATSVARRPVKFPYVPRLLAFRELPAILAALANLHTPPDLILCDGQGIAHPRRFGIAIHLGVLLDVPTIGAAKTRLSGRHAEPPNVKGAWTPLLDGAETIGAVVRTRVGVKPVFVSIGHRVSLNTAIELTLACVTRYRLPETTRQAHHLASAKREDTGQQ